MGNREQVEAILGLYKHYGNIRFIMLPMYFTTAGILFYAYWTVLLAGEDGAGYLNWIAIAGIILSLLFVVYEWTLNSIMKSVTGLFPLELEELKHGCLIGPVAVVTLGVYGFPLVFWAAVLIFY